jgi:hypothetical protein
MEEGAGPVEERLRSQCKILIEVTQTGTGIYLLDTEKSFHLLAG